MGAENEKLLDHYGLKELAATMIVNMVASCGFSVWEGEDVLQRAGEKLKNQEVILQRIDCISR